MKWTFGIENKIKASIILLILCGVVLFSNYRLKKLSGRVADSVETIYKDRLIVQDLIFSYDQLLDSLYSLKEYNQSSTEYLKLTSDVEALEKKYLGTVLTDEEKKVFSSFSRHIAHVVSSRKPISKDHIVEMRRELQRLEAIQMEEAERQMDIIHKAEGSQNLGFYLETVMLVILLITVQVLVISSTGLKKIISEQNINYN